jgi:hypothetical protein
MVTFKLATRTQAKLRLALTGPSGSGKTYSALSIAAGLGERVAVIDTEHASASLYADRFRFDSACLSSFSPDAYVEAIHAAEAGGYEVIVIDSLSHAWMGKDGALEQVDRASHRSSSKNSYFAWRDVTPKHNALIEAMVQSKAHIIATMRAKTEYALDKDDKGKMVPRKVGLAPVQRDGMEYEFGVAGELDLDHCLSITKSRCSELAGKLIQDPGLELAKVLRAWLESGAAAEPIEEPDAERAPMPSARPASLTPAETKARRDRLRDRIRAAKTLEALDGLVPVIKALPEADRRAVRPDFGKRHQELMGIAAGVTR